MSTPYCRPLTAPQTAQEPMYGRTESAMPGLSIAELRSWQQFTEAALRLSATLNRELAESHKLSLDDVRLLQALGTAPNGAMRMGDIADALMASPSRITRHMRRLESRGLAERTRSDDDGRGVLAAITDSGREVLRHAVTTYATGVRRHFLDQLSRPQVAAVGENCRRVNAALKQPQAPLGKLPVDRAVTTPRRTGPVAPPLTIARPVAQRTVRA
jgi:DNA-binding MarR family transcriptional regulator